MNYQTSAAELLHAHCFPLIEGLDDFSAVPKRQFESPTGISLPPQVICREQEVHHAVARAAEAHRIGEWRNSERTQRKAVLLRWADFLERQASDLALLDCVQTGRALSNFTQQSIPKSIEALRWFAELADKTEDRSISEGHVPRYLTVMRREPLGVVAAIIPWNDPLVVFIWKVAPALICGNAVVVKPSEHAFHSLLLAAKLGYEAGLPAGQLQLLTGDSSTGAALVREPLVTCISFTGSSATGKWIASEASRDHLKRVSLECGGKSGFIVSDKSRKIEAAAKCLAKNVFYNQGQICSAPTRAYVHSAVFDQFMSSIVAESSLYAPSHPLTGKTDVGYMIHRDAVKRVNLAIVDAASRGYLPALNGSAIDPERCIHPSIFIDIPEHDPLAQQELFGPVLIINRVGSINEAVMRANASSFGLAAGIWTDDLEEAIAASARLETGTVHVNSYGEDGNQIPFGGIKDSGIGKEKSVDTLTSYSHVKSVCIRLSDGDAT
jgi:acyl-CoA reductase-like NAD-dependent aldehyde dehydrogenase